MHDNNHSLINIREVFKAMSTEQNPINKIFLLLQSNGFIVLDKEYLWDGCDTPELDPSIEMPPISIRQLAKLCSSRNLDWPERDEAKKLKILLKELLDSADIIADTIMRIESKI